MRVWIAALTVALMLASSSAFARRSGSKHSGSHGGSYRGGKGGSSHKGGHYKNPKGGSTYGKHK